MWRLFVLPMHSLDVFVASRLTANLKNVKKTTVLVMILEINAKLTLTVFLNIIANLMLEMTLEAAQNLLEKEMTATLIMNALRD
jgi:hypothetical protein